MPDHIILCLSQPILSDAPRTTRDSGARQVLVQPIGFAMAASLLAWLPGAVTHWRATEGAGVEV